MTRKAEVTEWISCRVKPVRNGWYECYYDNTVQQLPPLLIRRYWNGKKWTRPEDGIVCFFGSQRGDKWRGLIRRAA